MLLVAGRKSGSCCTASPGARRRGVARPPGIVAPASLSLARGVARARDLRGVAAPRGGGHRRGVAVCWRCSPAPTCPRGDGRTSDRGGDHPAVWARGMLRRQVLQPRRGDARVVLGHVRKRRARHRGLSGLTGLAVCPRHRGLSGLLLCLVCRGGVGAASRLCTRRHVRPCGSALAVWLTMVFAVEHAALLAAVVALAPPRPQFVGTRGQSGLAAPGRRRLAIPTSVGR